MFDNINVNLRKNEGFLTSIPCIPIPEYGQSNALLGWILRKDNFSLPEDKMQLSWQYGIKRCVTALPQVRNSTNSTQDKCNCFSAFEEQHLGDILLPRHECILKFWREESEDTSWRLLKSSCNFFFFFISLHICSIYDEFNRVELRLHMRETLMPKSYFAVCTCWFSVMFARRFVCLVCAKKWTLELNRFFFIVKFTYRNNNFKNFASA